MKIYFEVLAINIEYYDCTERNNKEFWTGKDSE